MEAKLISEKKSFQCLDLAPLIVRITLAVVFIYHGYGKVFGGGHAGIASMMEAQGAPFPVVLGWMAALAEFAGGILLLVGFLSRVWALGMAILMSVAIATVHWKHGFDLRGADGATGYEYCFVLWMMALSILLGGAGAISLDRKLFRGCSPIGCETKKEE
jgi:putative oxidoreductase